MKWNLRGRIPSLSLLGWCVLTSTVANVAIAGMLAWFLFSRPVVRTEEHGIVEVRGAVEVDGTVAVENTRKGAVDVRIVGR